MAVITVATLNLFNKMGRWDERSPLGWDLDKDRTAVATSAVYLLSGLSEKVTGEILHVDGGFHITALPLKDG